MHQLLIIYSVFVKEKKWENNEAVHQLFIDFKKANDPVRWEVFYNILFDFVIPKKLVRLEELNDLYSAPNIIWVVNERRMRWAGI